MLGAALLWVVGPKKAVWDESKVIYKIFNIIIELWMFYQVSYDPCSYETNLCNCV